MKQQSTGPKVLHITVSDHFGGAGKAAYRLQQALCEEGVDSWMLVDDKQTEDARVINYHQGKLRNNLWKLRSRLDKLPSFLTRSEDSKYRSYNYIPNPELEQAIRSMAPDLVHLHWIGDGLFPIEMFAKIQVPIVATLHGRWLFNGSQHLHSDQSTRFVEGFHEGNRDQGDGAWDVDRWTWLRKQKVFEGLNINIVALSQWMERDARRSLLLQDKRIIRIPNGLDSALFFPENVEKNKRELGLQSDKKTIVFGANFAGSDLNKGLSDILTAVKTLEDRGFDFELLVFGSEKPKEEFPFKVNTHFKGYVVDEIILRKIYSVGDCFVLASKQDNLPNTVMESLACGTPSVGYDVGGVSDMIEDGVTGFLAEPENPQSLANGIERIFQADSSRMTEFRRACRLKFEAEFTMKKQATSMMSFYDEILRETSNSGLTLKEI